jgi:hypothetical protein
MPRDDFERYRKRLEEQLRADIGLLYKGYLAKLRAYQAVDRLRGEVEVALPPVPAIVLHLPAAPSAAARRGTPPPPQPPQRSGSHAVLEALEAALPRLPEEFDRADVLAVLDFEPRRSTLVEALNTLEREGVLLRTREAAGRHPAQFRKIQG